MRKLEKSTTISQHYFNCQLRRTPIKESIAMMILEPLKQKLLAINLVNNNYFIGCTHQEIIELEQQLGVKFPKAYQEFLLLMGKKAGQFLQGSDCFYPHLLYLQEAAFELLEENDFPQPLPKDAFVFLMHQGYQFSFFRLTEGEDPPTYYYCEGETQQSFIKSHERFSEFLEKEIDLYKKFMMAVVTK